MFETILVVILYFLYIFLWAIKRTKHKNQFGIDPNVMAHSKSNLQQFMNNFSSILTIYAALIILLHASNLQFGSAFNRLIFISNKIVDILGLNVGLLGLGLCCYAQITMGSSWRVGIDEKNQTPLVTNGIFKWIRNPTYLGLFLLNIGVWLIWPTWTIFILNLAFYLFLEVQVRCEEEFLLSIHSDTYRQYFQHTKRYIPFIY